MENRAYYEHPTDPKPKKEFYGYESSNSFNEDSGWMIEGGEDAYHEALKVWENRQEQLRLEKENK